MIVLAASRVQVTGEVDDLLATHHRLIGARMDPRNLPGSQQVLEASHTDRSSLLVIHCEDPVLDPAWTVERISLDDLVPAYMAQAAADAKEGRKGVLAVQR